MSSSRARGSRVVVALVATALLGGLLARLLRPDDEPVPTRAASDRAERSLVTGEPPTASEQPGAGAPSAGSPVDGVADVTSASAVWRCELTLDGAPWANAVVVLRERGEDLQPTGRERTFTADTSGSFALDLEPGFWGLTGGPGWPARWTVSSDPSEWGAEGRLFVCVHRSMPDWEEGDVRALVPTDEAAGALRLDVQTPVRIAGRVVGATGAPVAGATVSRPRGAGATTPVESGAGGAFAIDVPWTGGLVELVAGAPDRAPGARVARFDSRADALRAEPLVIELGHALLPVAGVVRDVDGAPVAGAAVSVKVDLADPDGETLPWTTEARSAADGRFDVAVPAGAGGVGPWGARVGIVATHPDFPVRAVWSGAVGPASPPAPLVLSRWTRIEGRVLDHDGAPLADVDVVEANATTFTGPDGRFTLEQVPERVQLTLRHRRGWRLVRAVLPLDAPLVVRFDAGSDGERVEGQLQDVLGRPLAHGHVMSAVASGTRIALPPRGGRPIVLAWGPVEADASGRFVLGPVPPGATVELRWDRDDEPVRVPAGARDVVLRQPVPPAYHREVRLRPVAIGGTITRLDVRAHGPPVLVTWDRGVVTLGPEIETKDGDVVTLSVWGGAREVWISAPGRREVARALPEGAAVVDLGEVVLEPAGALALRLRLPHVPVLALAATWRDPDGRERSAASWAGVRPETPWVIHGLAPGPLRLEVRAEGDGAGWTAVVDAVARVGETIDVDVDLESAAPTPR